MVLGSLCQHGFKKKEIACRTRLPVTTHHVMPSFLNTYMEDMSNDGFFENFGIDACYVIRCMSAGVITAFAETAEQQWKKGVRTNLF